MSDSVIEVRGDGAFGVNSVGLNRRAFPLTFSVREVDGAWIVSGTAAQACELVDWLVRSASDTVVVVALETTSFWAEDFSLWPPSRIAAEQGVGCTVHRVGEWAGGTPGLGDELLVMRRDDLPRFLDGSWSPYELSIVDVPAHPTGDQLDEIALVVGSAVPGEPVLPRLPGSRLWFSGHDDCYLMVESSDATVPASLFSRLIALLGGSAAVGAAAASSVAVPEPDIEALEPLIRQSPYWIGVLANHGDVRDGTIAVHLSALPERWRLGEDPPGHIDWIATLDLHRGRWDVTPASRQRRPTS